MILKLLGGHVIWGLWGALILGWIWGRFGVVLGAPGVIWEVGGELGHIYVKKGGGSSMSLVPFGHEKWSQELPQTRPEDPKIDRSSPEERSKRRCEEKSVKTSKTSTLSSEKRGFDGRGGPEILKNRSRSGLEGVKSTIITQY